MQHRGVGSFTDASRDIADGSAVRVRENIANVAFTGKQAMPQFRFQTPVDWQKTAAQAAELAIDPAACMEHRWGQRIPCTAQVRVCAVSGISGSGRLRNVSMSGAFLDTTLSLPLFAQLSIAVLHADGTARAGGFMATVVRTEAGGAGIEWSEPCAGPVCRMLGCTAECTSSGNRCPG